MIPETSRTGETANALVTPDQQADAGRVRRTLGELFPEASPSAGRTWSLRALSVAIQVAAVGIATVVMLLRIPLRLPSWDTIYAEDYFVFLTQALQKHWNIFIGYNSDWQFLPRVIAQFVVYLPITQAARAFAVAGALVAACCALFIYHASAGHVRSARLRALLAVALVLLPATPMEIIDSGVNSVWYLMPAAFWALLWRPRTRTGMAVALVVAFAAAASNSLCFLFLPLAAARLYALRRPREHAVTIGWLAGCLAQVPFIISAYESGSSRVSNSVAPPGLSLAFYGHDVVLPAFGWHLVWWLRSLAGLNGATALVGVVLVAIFAVILVTQAGARPFVVTALVIGFIFPVLGITVTAHLARATMFPAEQPGSRYTVLPIYLFVSAVIVGVDYALRRRRMAQAAQPAQAAQTGPGPGAARGAGGIRPAMAVTALVAVLAFSWVVDFQYVGWRSNWGWTWAPIAAKWQHDCAVSTTGQITEKAGAILQTLPCDRIRS
jgi:hypothetical protein